MDDEPFNCKGCALVIILDILSWIAIVVMTVFLLRTCYG
jgi:hypothetical protein